MLRMQGFKQVSMTITVNQKTRELFPASVRRQAGFKTGDRLEVRVSGGIVSFIPTLPSADEDYTPAQRRLIDARLAKADEDIREGRVYGPFNTAAEMIASMKAESKKRVAAKTPKRTHR
jgi:bifunctional DNA-binding transcriptional regulator/antitoxin component of YhaV-PrlF toxin-antitoxin module